MEGKNRELSKGDFIALEYSIRELESTLSKYLSYLDKHISAMEELTEAIIRLEAIIQKEGELKITGPSHQLKEVVTYLMNCHINPRYYQDMGFLQLKGDPPQTTTARSDGEEKNIQYSRS